MCRALSSITLPESLAHLSFGPFIKEEMEALEVETLAKVTAPKQLSGDLYLRLFWKTALFI